MAQGALHTAADPTGTLARFTAGLVGGIAITFGLFWSMHFLIETADHILDDLEARHWVEFVRVKRDERVERRRIKPDKPPPPEAPPPEPPAPKLDEVTPSADKFAIPVVRAQTEIALTGGFNLGVSEGDYLPIVKVAPIYPRRALSRGIEGYCVVEYTVTRLGTVKDVSVVESECTSSLFKEASVKAAAKFKYKPRVVDGVAVEVPGVRNQFTFRIEQ
ncbi:MAG: energy transducer TonB [Gammaproteobacteria bacterium]|nr:energy transducer TonB [Gammaproteobacteria bacterium]